MGYVMVMELFWECTAASWSFLELTHSISHQHSNVYKLRVCSTATLNCV